MHGCVNEKTEVGRKLIITSFPLCRFIINGLLVSQIASLLDVVKERSKTVRVRRFIIRERNYHDIWAFFFTLVVIDSLLKFICGFRGFKEGASDVLIINDESSRQHAPILCPQYTEKLVWSHYFRIKPLPTKTWQNWAPLWLRQSRFIVTVAAQTI